MVFKVWWRASQKQTYTHQVKIIGLIVTILFIIVNDKAEAGSVSESMRLSGPSTHFKWTYGESAEKTYLLTNCHWWESVDHQLTTIITLLTLAQNTSSIAVIPSLATASTHGKSNRSLLGDYFNLNQVTKVQPAMTFSQFKESEDYQLLRKAETGTIALPKESQEEYEARLQIYGRLHSSVIELEMPKMDPENTNQPCHRFSGTMHLSKDGTRRFVFLDRVHFFHFCTEKFMPWWYDVRQYIQPRQGYYDVANRFIGDMRRPFTVVHVNDVMEAQRSRNEEDVERYAGQIVDGLRSHEAVDGSLYTMYAKSGRNVGRVVKLLQAELDHIYDCSAMFSCVDAVRQEWVSTSVGDSEFHTMFRSEHAPKMTEWALAAQADLFIGNIHSPKSRHICLFRKLHGLPYVAVKGFGELRKVWSWNL